MYLRASPHYLIFLLIFTTLGIWGALAFQQDETGELDLPLKAGAQPQIYRDPPRKAFESILEAFKRGEGFEPLSSGDSNMSRLEFVSCWLYLPFDNQSNQDVEHVLEVDYRWMDRAVLYAMNADGSYSVYQSGEEVPLSEKMIASRKQAFYIRLAAGEQKEYFLYLRDYYWLNPSLTLWESNSTFLQNVRTEEQLIYTYLGLLGGLFVMNFCVFIVFRYKDVLYYLYYLLSIGLLQFINFGLHFPLLGALSLEPYYPENDINYFLLSGALSLSSGLLMLFSREFLQIKQLSKPLASVAQIVGACFIIIAPLFMFGPAIVLGKWVTPIVVGTCAVGHVSSLALGIFAAWRQQTQARYFIPALLFLMLVAWRFNWSLMTGSVASLEILIQWLFASGLEMMIFAFALSERFLMIEKEKGAAREAMLEEAAKHARLQQQYNERLESEVAARTAELEDSNQQKDELFKIIAHDLKSPIDGVSKLSRTLAEARGLQAEEIEQGAREIRRSVTHLSELTKNLLDWGKIRSHQNSLELQPYLVGDLRELAEQTLQTFSFHKSLLLKWEVPRNVFASFDFNGIATVLRNLIINAAKYSESGQTICVKGTVMGQELLLSVVDQGCGIDSTQIERIQQCKPCKSMIGTGGEQGIGIGLQICQDILKSHGSELNLSSQLGKGTTCSFKLTVWDSQQAESR
jgi:signal transduction histidine kinase